LRFGTASKCRAYNDPEESAATFPVIDGVRWCVTGDHALVVPRSGGGPPDDLDAHVRRHVAGYKSPRAVVTVKAIERFPSGKPDYGWGRETAAALLVGG
jgi:acyl-CoA synthetase (AMP-forming)/AMP-acid ligase II